MLCCQSFSQSELKVCYGYRIELTIIGKLLQVLSVVIVVTTWSCRIILCWMGYWVCTVMLIELEITVTVHRLNAGHLTIISGNEKRNPLIIQYILLDYIFIVEVCIATYSFSYLRQCMDNYTSLPSSFFRIYKFYRSIRHIPITFELFIKTHFMR